MDLQNCPNCNELFVKTNFLNVCGNCYKKEEAQFDAVYQFIRKRANRTATMAQVVEATEVAEELITKFMKKRKLNIAQFPNLGFPCERCGTLIQDGRLCASCTSEIRSDLTQFEKEEQRRKGIR